MKTKNLIYLAGAAVVAYFIFKKKKTATATAAATPTILQEASKQANDILTIIPNLPAIEKPIRIKEYTTPEVFEMPIQRNPPQLFLKPPAEPIRITQSEVIDTPQLSPTPASILSPDQLIRFETKAAKAQLMGIC